jgi:hypothetical protein
MLRRRNRLLIQEAIRNGTWIPPSEGGIGAFATMRGRSGRNMFDPSKKPKIWEAAMENGRTDIHSKQELDWDSIKPFSATAIGVRGPDPVDPALENLSSEPTAVTTGSSRRDRRSFFQSVLRLFDPTPSSPFQMSRQLQVADLTTPNDNNDSSGVEGGDTGVRCKPHNVRIAVLIAMPSQWSSRSSPRLNMPALASEPSTPHLPLSAESSPLFRPLPGTPSEEGEGIKEVPHLEFGIVDLGVRQDRDAEESGQEKIEQPV